MVVPKHSKKKSNASMEEIGKCIKDMSLEEVIDFMKERPCSKNMQRYREDLTDLRAGAGCAANTNISHGRLKQEREDMIRTMKPLGTQMAYKHRLLNSYLKLYQERLSLLNTKAETKA